MMRATGIRGILLAVLMLLSLQSLCATGVADPWRPLERQWFDSVGMAEGLPHSITTALAQDRSGVLWIGTMGGLVRYDGYRVQVFELAGTTGLPDSYVRSLLALPDGGLMVGTNAGGLARFDPQTGHFRSYPIGPDGISNRKIYMLAADGNRGVWIATDSGLDRLDLHTNHVATVATGALAAPRDFSVLQDRAGNLWLGNDKGLFVRYAGSRDFVRPPHPAGVIDAVLRDKIWALRQDAEGRLWVGSVQMGAVYLEADGRWQTIPGFSGYTGMARQATVRDFLEVAPDRMWIATDGTGIVTYAPGDASTRLLDHDTSLPSSLPGNSVRALLLDRSGNTWAATDLGAARSNAKPTIAFTVLPSADAAHSLASPDVRSILVDARGRIWLGMAAGKIDLIDLAAATVHHLQLPGKQLRRDVQRLAEAPDGSIWVGTQGLARIDPVTLAIRGETLPALGDDPVLSLLRDGPRMLIGTYDGVYRYDTRNGELIHFRHVAGQHDSLASDTVHQIVRVGTAVWYATNNGVSIAHDPLQTAGFVNLTQHNDDPASLPQNLVDSIVTDAHGRVWTGTLGGLGMLPGGGAPPYRFRTFGTAEGLASDKINALLPDLDGNIWVSTSNGVSVVGGDNLRIRNLGIRDGQRITSYIYAAAACMPDGTLLFGGLGGLTVIRPQSRSATDLQVPLRITNALVNGHPLPFGHLPDDHGTLELSAHERNLRLDFALLDYQAPQETAYSYRMAGFDDEWIDVPKGTAPSAIYTNLPHGHYVLHLRALPRGLHEHVVENTLAIDVAPRWYETLPVRLLALALLLALVVLLVQLRTIYLRQRAAQLQVQIDAHTRELVAANRRLDRLAATDELTGVLTRRRFLELAEEVRRNAGSKPAFMALLDLDRFKQVNDRYGHLAGDAVLRSAAGIVCRQLRAGDLIGRYGGEELIVCLPDITSVQALAIAGRILMSLRENSTRHEGRAIAITASIGIAELHSGESMTAWLSRADAALYESKHRGRDCCTLAG